MNAMPAPSTSPYADLMPIDHIDDWERRLARADAFWQREIIDRPVVCISLPKERPLRPAPAERGWPSLRERWMDAEYQAEAALAHVENTDYLGDALPTAWPNLGPEVFSAFFGAELEYGETTSWSKPNLEDWADAEKLEFSEQNPYYVKLLEMTDAMLEVGRGKFYTGLTDLHPGGDAIVAFRDPMNMNLDMIESLDEVKALLARINDTYLTVFEELWGRLSAARQACTAWIGIVSSRKYYIPSNDFSCMISKDMFDEVFLPGIRRECQALEASIYHLDGPQALRHLDSLLEIPELNAIQWVYGAGNGPVTRWMDVYKRCQAAGKGLQIYSLRTDELDVVMKELRPEGLWLGFEDVRNREHAEHLIERVTRWR
jgi:hypothetical protein